MGQAKYLLEPPCTWYPPHEAMSKCYSTVFGWTEIITNQFLNCKNKLNSWMGGYYFLKILATMYTKALLNAYLFHVFLLQCPLLIYTTSLFTLSLHLFKSVCLTGISLLIYAFMHLPVKTHVKKYSQGEMLPLETKRSGGKLLDNSDLRGVSTLF